MDEECGPIFRDIRKYYCQYCGICRSKKALITSHILSNHQEELKEKNVEEKIEGPKSNTCHDCGAIFRKPAYLEQHMLSHSLERPFICPLDDCNSSYRRKDHLNRHILQHQGKLFKCPFENCKVEFSFEGNVQRHVNEFHDEESSSIDNDGQKQYICQELGCGKIFKYLSKLRKHEDSHVKLDSVEVICCEPDCMKHFPNEECLKAHFQLCHQRIECDICGTKQLKKNIKRHLRTHETSCSSQIIKCEFENCLHTFATNSNLNQHVKAVHLGLRPFSCRIAGCGMTFPFKHVRDNHEKTSLHTYTHGDFVESDVQFRMRPRGGRKRKCPQIESLVRKRVTLPIPDDIDSVSEGFTGSEV